MSSYQEMTTLYLNQYSGGTLQTEAIAFIILPTIAVALRCYARFLTSQFWADDYLLFAGYVAQIAQCIAAIRIVEYGGVGYHIQKVIGMDPALMVGWAKGIYAVEIIYLASTALPKLSALVFYLRVFVSHDKQTLLRPLAISTIVLVIANWFAFTFTAFFQCKPLAFWWDKTIIGGKCFDIQTFYRASCIPNLFTDFAVLALPISSIYKLKMRPAKKVSLIAIFMTAGVGVVASILRFKTFFDTDAFTDPTWASVALVGWSVIEGGCYTIAACLPHLRPVATKISSSISSGSIGSSFEMRKWRKGVDGPSTQSGSGESSGRSQRRKRYEDNPEQEPVGWQKLSDSKERQDIV